MSDGEERGSGEQEVEPAIWAVAPRLHQEQGPVDVSASPAFQCLDEVSFLEFSIKKTISIISYNPNVKYKS